MTPNEFDALVDQGYNRIPVVCEVLADLDTPLSVYLKLVEGPFGFLFESVHGGEKWGRYSIIGLPCHTLLKAVGDQVTVEADGRVVESTTVADPLAFVEAFKDRYRVPELPDMPRFGGGLVGYFGYETVGYIEPRLRNPDKPDPLACRISC
jgi:anthranilate synthase component 1